MTKRVLPLLAILALTFLGAVDCFAQMTTVQGTVKDSSGAKVVNATVDWHNIDNNHDYKLKTNKKGNYQGIVPIGHYDVLTFREGNTDTSKPDHKIPNFELKTSQDPFQTYDIVLDAAADSDATTATTTTTNTNPVPTPTINEKELSSEQKKKIEEVNKKNEEIKKENTKIGNINQMMTDARADIKANEFDKAIELMTQATTQGNYDLPFGVLGDAHLGAKHYQEAADAYTKAISLNAASAKPNMESQGVWNYSLGRAYARLQKVPEAQAAFDTAAKDQPTNAAKYYYNEGVEFMNQSKNEAAMAAFDKAIAADAKLPDPYFQKGVLLISQSTTQNGKMVAPAGTAEALNKYLELAPSGPNAPAAQELLAQIGAKVTTRVKNK